MYLLRHGETEWNRDGNRYCGLTDIPLSDIGREQAELAADYLKSVPFQAVYASPLIRAYETAKIISSRHDLPIQTDKRIQEIDFGSWEGKPKEQLIEEDSQAWSAWLNDPTDVPAGGTGETAREVYVRAKSFFDEAARKHIEKTILVVGHNTLNRFFITGCLSAPFRSYRSIKQNNTGITVFEMKDNVEFIQMNLHEHLSGKYLSYLNR
jgi:uncharacterized phosphatase